MRRKNKRFIRKTAVAVAAGSGADSAAYGMQE